MEEKEKELQAAIAAATQAEFEAKAAAAKAVQARQAAEADKAVVAYAKTNGLPFDVAKAELQKRADEAAGKVDCMKMTDAEYRAHRRTREMF